MNDKWGYIELPELAHLPNSLRILSMDSYHHNLASLPEGLETLICFGCNLKELRNLPLGLKKLICPSNDLKSIDELPPGLIELDCSFPSNEGRHIDELMCFMPYNDYQINENII